MTVRVAITLPSHRTGGIARYGWNLAAALQETAGVDLVAVGDAAALVDAAALGAVDGIEVPASSMGQILAIRHNLAGQLEAAGVELFHGLKHVVPRSWSGASILTAHDDFLFTRAADYGTIKRLVLPRIYRGSLRSSALVLGVSDVAAASIRDRRLADDVRTVRHPFVSDLSSVPAAPVVLPDHGAPFALFVGEWLARKNVELLVRIWPAVHDRTGARLVLAGPERGFASTVEAVRAAEAAGLATVLGRVSDPELRWLYEHAHLTCVPSLEEGWGLPVTESLSLGTPVVAGTHPALVEAGGGGAEHLAITDAEAWTDRICQHLAGPKVAPPASRDDGRGWPEVAAEVAAAYRSVAAAHR